MAKVLGRERQPTGTTKVLPTTTKKSADEEELKPTKEPTATEEILPVVTVSGQFSETLSGTVNTSRPLGTTFEITVDFTKGTIAGDLSGGRTTSGNPVDCVDGDDASIVLDTAYVDYTDAYNASFSGSINLENGDFTVKITPKGGTTDRVTTPYTVENCLNLNSKPAPGSGGWTGDGSISGHVTKDGSIEFSTDWSSFGGNIIVRGNWSGEGTVVSP